MKLILKQALVEIVTFEFTNIFRFTLKMMLQYGRIAIDANTNEKFNQITINHAQVKSYITSFPMNWGILYKGADDSKLKKSVNL